MGDLEDIFPKNVLDYLDRDRYGSEREWRVLKFKWEFMRRDPEVKASPPPDMPDLNLSFEKMLEACGYVNQIEYGEMIVLDHRVLHKLRRQLEVVPEVQVEKVGETGIRIEIDFAKVNSITELKNDIASKLDFYWFNHRWRTSRKISKFSDFDVILTIGDLKEKEPDLTHWEIAQRIFPGDKSPESAVKKVSQHLRRYRKLVNGGWKEIQAM